MTRDQFNRLLPQLVKNYRPAAAVISQIKQIRLVMVIGPTGVGKSTIIGKLGLPYVPSHTTRKPRPGEVDGQDFYFLSDYGDVVKQIKAGVFVQMVAGVSGDLYATKASSYPASGMAVMPVLADVVPFFRKLGFGDTLSAFIVPPSYEEWMRRISTHGLPAEQKDKRLDEAKRSLAFALSDRQTHFILNDDLDKAVQQTKDALIGKSDEQREKQARAAAQEILNRID
jgi:guanylate kinase